MRILYIDKDIVFRDYVSMFLETGYDAEVIEASSNNEAIFIMDMDDEGIPDIIFSDYESGKYETALIDYLKDKNLKIPILWLIFEENKNQEIILSSVSTNENNGVVVKPFKEMDLIPILEKTISDLGLDIDAEETSVSADIIDVTDTVDLIIDSEVKNDSISTEEEADWSLKQKSKAGGEEDADWSLKNEGEAGGEEDADWSLKNKSTPIEVVDSEKIINKLKRKPQKTSANGEYVGVKIKRFLNFNTLCCDAFIKLSEKKYLKLINENDLYDKDHIDKYINKKILYLYIKIDRLEDFQKYFEQTVLNQIEMNNLSKEERVRQTTDIHDLIIEEVSSLGVEKGVILKTKPIISATAEFLLNNFSKVDDLQKVIKGNDFLTGHSMMISYVVAQLLKKANMDNKSTLEKLSMAALMHDLSLTDSKLSKIRSQNSSKFNELSSDEKEVFLNHPEYSVSIIRKAAQQFPDVDTIIYQHEERPDGSGFPKRLTSSSIHPLTAYFIVAEHFVHKVYDKEIEPELMLEITQELSPLYTEGHFKKAYQKLEETLLA